MYFSHSQLCNEQNPEFHVSDTTDMIDKDLYTSYDKSGFDCNVFDDDTFCNFDDDQSIMFDYELHKSEKNG